MDAPLPRDLPEAALAAVEDALGLAVTVHDHLGLLISFLPPRRTHHLQPPCAQVKTQRQSACTAFDHDALLAAIPAHRQGLIKRCHAGIVEWVMPVFAGERHWLTIYAGPRSAGPGLVVDLDSHISRTGFWAPQVTALPQLRQPEAGAVMEVLRQLAARLDAWREHDLPRLVAPPEEHWKRNRRAEIHAWVVAHHLKPAGLAELASHLHLSQDRTRHAVQELCGTTLTGLLTAERLATARELLSRTDMPVAGVALASGFRNRKHFHAVFRAETSESPARWRQRRRQLTA